MLESQPNQVRCNKCNRLLGYTGSEYKLYDTINSAICEDGKITLHVKCSRCGALVTIEFKK